MTTTWQSFGRNKPDRETMLYWFNKLINYDFVTVANAFDKWIIAQKELPTVNEIIKLCQPVTPIYNAIARKVDAEANKQNVKKLTKFVEERMKPKTDYKAWARRIVDNPSMFPESSLKIAEEALAA